MNFGSSFLPAPFQGTPIGGEGQSLANAVIPNIANRELSREQQRKQLDLLQTINRDPALARQGQQRAGRRHRVVRAGLPHADRRAQDHGFQGTNRPARWPATASAARDDNLAASAWMARRFAEAGVRFIELGSTGWDHHNNLHNRLTANCGQIDQPIGALLADLKQRDMLKDTLVVWGGEFGRTPHAQNADGRDHNAVGYSMWLPAAASKGASATARRRAWHPLGRKQSPHPRPCTPPSCTSSASITSGSPTATPAATSA